MTPRRALAAAVMAALAGGCGRGEPSRDRPRADDPGAGPPDTPEAAGTPGAPGGPGDAAAPDDPAWAALAGVPRAYPRWRRRLAVAPVPAVDVHGPLVVDGVAVIAGSALGWVGLEPATGAVRWQRGPTGRVAMPAALDGGGVLAVGDCPDAAGAADAVACFAPLDARTGARRATGALRAELAVVGALGGGPTAVAVDGDRLWLGRDGAWLTARVDLAAGGEAFLAPAEPRELPPAPALARTSLGAGDDRIDLWVVDDVLELRHHDPAAVSSRTAVRAIAGAPGSLQPLGDDRVRAFELVDGQAAVQPVTLDARTIVRLPVGRAWPGIALLAAADGPGGFVAAVRLDASLTRDYVVAVAADGAPRWAYPLPPPEAGRRALPVGLAIAGDTALVFRDGEVVEGLPAP